MKNLLTIAASTIFLGAIIYAEPASAGQDKCWFQMKPNASALDPVSCRISERTNSNGHRVYDVIESDGYTRTVVLWGNARAEVLVEGKNLNGDWQVDTEGDVRISMDAGGDWAFKPKNISAISSGQSVKRVSAHPANRIMTVASVTQQPRVAPTPRAQGNNLNLSSVVSSWNNNQVAAIRNFNGKRVVINGYVDGIYPGRINIHQAGASDYVTCYYTDSNRVASLNHRQPISVSGNLTVRSGPVFGSRFMEIRNCAIS